MCHFTACGFLATSDASAAVAAAESDGGVGGRSFFFPEFFSEFFFFRMVFNCICPCMVRENFNGEGGGKKGVGRLLRERKRNVFARERMALGPSFDHHIRSCI